MCLCNCAFFDGTHAFAHICTTITRSSGDVLGWNIQTDRHPNVTHTHTISQIPGGGFYSFLLKACVNHVRAPLDVIALVRPKLQLAGGLAYFLQQKWDDDQNLAFRLFLCSGGLTTRHTWAIPAQLLSHSCRTWNF